MLAQLNSNDDIDYDGESIVSASDVSSVSTNLNNTSNFTSDLNISVEYKEGLRCLYTNIDCISNKWTELETLINMQQPHIVGITEVFPKTQDNVNLSAYTLEGFQQLINPRFSEQTIVVPYCSSEMNWKFLIMQD